jgi:addiction module RelB/DinJ family antitoxin
VRANKKFSKMENLYDQESDIMANTSAVYARIDNDLKENAEEILAQLGITPSSAIQMLYSQIVLQRGLPFEAKLPYRKPVAWGALTPEEQEAELQKGIDDVKNGRVVAFKDVKKKMQRLYDL